MAGVSASSKKQKAEAPWRIGVLLFNEVGPPFGNYDDVYPRFLEVMGYTPGGMVKVRSMHWKDAGLPEAGAVLPRCFLPDWISSTLRILPDASGVCFYCQGTPGRIFRSKVLRRASDNSPYFNVGQSKKYCEYSYRSGDLQGVYQHFQHRSMKKWVAPNIAEGFALAGWYPEDLVNLIIDFVL